METKKKILFVITKSNWGGAQKYVFDLAASLPPSEYDVAVALGGEGSKGAEEGELARRLAHNHLRTIFISSFMRDISIVSDLTAFFDLLKLFTREKPTTIHLNSSKAGGIGALAGRVAGIKNIIFTSHGLAYDEDRNFFVRTIIWLVTWITFLLCDHVIVLSQDTYRRARQLPFCNNKTRLIYNGIRTLEFKTRERAREEISKRSGSTPKESSVWIGTISEFTKNKGLSYLIEAAKIIDEHKKNFELFIIGSNGEEKGLITKKIKDFHLEERVHIVGFVPDAFEHLSAFNIFALTSVKEGLPYVLLEAGQAGCAVVCSNIPGVTDIVEDNHSGFLATPKDSADIARKLIHLIEREDECNRLGAGLRKRVIEQFSLKKMVEETGALY